MEDVYKQLARKLNELPNGYPETESGVEIRILKKIFSPEEAEMTLKINPVPETAEAISQRLTIPLEEMQAILDRMVERGQIASARMKGDQVYMLAPFMIGIFEFQLNRLDKELVDLFEEYAPALMTTLGNVSPAVMRVVPINAQIRGQQEIHPYEDIRQTLERAKSFEVRDCICRKEAAIQGHPCKHSIKVCLSFSQHEGAFDRYHQGRIITKEEALEVLDKAEEEGLVHATYNVQSGQMFVCNCCSCCCAILKATERFKVPHLVAKSNYVAYIDPETCVACGTCADERCPVKAIKEEDACYKVDPERCIGCGVCTPTCPTDAISLLKKPAELHEQPPRNIVDWYMQRAANRAASVQ